MSFLFETDSPIRTKVLIIAREFARRALDAEPVMEGRELMNQMPGEKVFEKSPPAKRELIAFLNKRTPPLVRLLDL